MKSKKISHGTIITAILAAVFIAAALTPVKTNTTATSSDTKIVSADYTLIPDTEIPLTATP